MSAKFEWIALRDMPHEFIITIGDGILPTDLKLFFDIDIDEWKLADEAGITLVHVVHYPGDAMMWDDLAVLLGQMPSKSQARKNGWSGEIPHGYSEMKRKFHRFYILKLGASQ